MAIEVTVAVLVAVLVAVAVVVGAATDDAGVFIFPPFRAATIAWSCLVRMVTDLASPESTLPVYLEMEAFLEDGLDIFGVGMVSSCMARIFCAAVMVLWVMVINDAVEGVVMATETDTKKPRRNKQ